MVQGEGNVTVYSDVCEVQGGRNVTVCSNVCEVQSECMSLCTVMCVCGTG